MMVMTENSVQNFYNHHEGFMQPTLVENYHHYNYNYQHQMDYNFPENGMEAEPKRSLCLGCGYEIFDQYILRVAPDLTWHAACLKCQECQQFLDESCTCFVREGKTYCKQDYVRLFGTKCHKCACPFSKNDFVMRAKEKIFHMECFRCTACDRELKSGDEFVLREGTAIYCKQDYDQMEAKTKEEAPSGQLLELNNNTPSASKASPCNITKGPGSSDVGSMTDSDSEADSYKSSTLGKSSRAVNGKPARVRTVLSEKQLSLLKSCYRINSRPDALVKEQLIEVTGLSPRVIRVWFQNKRCKDKKKSIEMKLQMQQETESKISYMQGVLLHAPPPEKHQPPMIDQGFEVTKYQQNVDFPIKSEPDHCTHTSGYQSLLQGYDLAMKQLKAITQNIGGKEDGEDWRKDWMKDSSNEST